MSDERLVSFEAFGALLEEVDEETAGQLFTSIQGLMSGFKTTEVFTVTHMLMVEVALAITVEPSDEQLETLMQWLARSATENAKVMRDEMGEQPEEIDPGPME